MLHRSDSDVDVIQGNWGDMIQLDYVLPRRTSCSKGSVQVNSDAGSRAELCRTAAFQPQPSAHSISIVPGGFEVMS